MIESSTPGTLLVSADFPMGSEQSLGATRLLEIFSRHRIPATWSVGDPGRSRLARLLLSSPLPHEIAILGDASWVGVRAGRTRLAAELTRRCEAAEAAGIHVRTLALRETSLQDHWDLLAKHRIRVVRTGIVTQTPSASVRPRSIRMGVWQTAPSASLPDETRWWPERSGLRAAQAAAAGAMVHWLVDGARCDQRHLRIIDRVLSYAAACQQSGRLKFSTIGGAVAAVATGHQATRPIRSILRSAA